MPSPPVVFSSVRSTWVNISNTAPSMSGGMPIPSSATATTAVAVVARDRQPDVPAPVRVLGGVVQQVGDDLGQPGRVAVHEDRLGRHDDGELVARLLDGRAARLHGGVDHRPQFDPLPAQFQLAARDPAHVEQVVHQPDHLRRVAAPSSTGPARPSRSPPASRMTWRPLRIGASGLRSSWARVARNSSFRRSCVPELADEPLPLRFGQLAVGDVAGRAGHRLDRIARPDHRGEDVLVHPLARRRWCTASRP